MADDATRNLSLPEFLALRARRATDGRLALEAAAGLLLAAGSAVAQPWGWWVLIPAGACLSAFGFWGIFDRELVERAPRIGLIGKAVLLTARGIAAGVGAVSALGVLFGALASALGTWVS